MCSDTRPLSHLRLSKGGYTLVEVLIASLIFSALVLLCSQAFDQSLRQYELLMKRGINVGESAKNLWIQRSVSSMVDYYVHDRTMRWFPYFIGEGKRICYISASPMANDTPVSVWIVKEEKDHKLSLIYYELPVYSSTFDELENLFFENRYKEGVSFEIIKEAERIEFSFYGYDHLKKNYEWFSEYEGQKKSSLPALIKISYVKDGIKDTIYLSVSTNSTSKVVYNELFQK